MAGVSMVESENNVLRTYWTKRKEEQVKQSSDRGH